MMASAAPAYVGEWKSFAPLSHVLCLTDFQGHVLAGTTGGLRSLNPVTLQEKSFGNLEGLLDVWITGLAKTDDGKLWVVSRSGYISEFDGRRFSAHGRGYVAERWTMNMRAVAAGGRFLALGSSKGLTFFDTRSHAAVASLTRFGNEIGDSVLAVLKRGDTLYITTPLAAYKAPLDWNDLLSVQKYGSIFDPRIWQKVVFPEQVPKPVDTLPVFEEPVVDPVEETPPEEDPVVEEDPLPPEDEHALPPEDSLPSADTLQGAGKRSARAKVSEDSTENQGPFVRRYNSLVWENDSLNTYGEGMILNDPMRVVAMRNEVVEIRGIRYPSLTTGYESALAYGARIFIGGLPGLIIITPRSDNDSVNFFLAPPPKSHPTEPIINLAANKGKVMGQYLFGFVDWNKEEFLPSKATILPSVELTIRTLRNLVPDPNSGDFYAGSWGQGLVRVRNGDSKIFKGDSLCPRSFVGIDNYYVTHAISRPYQDGLWMGMFLQEIGKGHQLVHFDIRDSSFTCMEEEGPGVAPHVLETLDDSLFAVGSDLGLYLYKYQTRPASLSLWKTIQAAGDVNDTWGVRPDGFERLWFIQGGKLAYADSLDQPKDKLEPKAIESFTGKDCRTLASDPVGGLWAGCQNGLYRIIPEASVRDTRITRYSVEDGLLSNFIFDIAVDPETGLVWAATDRGVSRLEGGVARPRTSFSDFKVFPNPFRKQHAFMVFDKLPPKSEVRIHSQDGQVVRTFHPRDLSGDQAQWNGLNDAGKPVKPGVYVWTVNAGKQSKRGRLIVAR